MGNTLANLVSSLGQRLQTLGSSMQTPSSTGDAAPAQPQDGHASSAWHKEMWYRGPALEPEMWGAFGRQISDRHSHQAPPPATAPAAPVTPSAPDVTTLDTRQKNGQVTHDTFVNFPDHSHVGVYQETHDGQSLMRTEAYDAQGRMVPAGVVVNSQTGSPEVHLMNANGTSITTLDLHDYHFATAGPEPTVGFSPTHWFPVPPPTAGTAGDAHLMGRKTRSFQTSQGVNVTTSDVTNDDHSTKDLSVYSYGPNLIRIDSDVSASGSSAQAVHLEGPLHDQVSHQSWSTDPSGQPLLNFTMTNGGVMTLDTGSHLFSTAAPNNMDQVIHG